MFIDLVKIHLKAGRGGDGAIAWRREKFVPSGGPAGGRGGDGGSIYFQADPDMQTLLDYKYKGKYVAQSGEGGKSKKMTGKTGEDLVLKVPLGTVVREAESGQAIADLSIPDQKFLVVKGGRGGSGNATFATSTKQAPRFAIPGEEGQELTVILELKLLADVGLVGLPNVGKSTILSILTRADPKVGNYHFTTLRPNLGVVDLGQGRGFVLADMPGLIGGASQGAGLGSQFLRHIERTRLLVHVLDISGSEARDPIEDFKTVQEELASYKQNLEEKVGLVVANKMDLPGAGDQLARFKSYLKKEGLDLPVIESSAAQAKGMKELKNAIWESLASRPKQDEPVEELVDREKFFRPDASIQVKRDGHVIYVTGQPVEDLSKKLIITDPDSVSFFERKLEEMGVMDQVRALNPTEEDTIDVVGFEFDWL